ncbi:MAG: sigma-70 family RNA polymerase sigma factor, partial [Planctomycetota bacterium]
MSLRASQKDPELDRWFADFRRGDHAALERLVLRTTPWLRAVARRAGARGNEIDEVVQDAWVEASSKAAIPPRSVPLLIWLATIVQHRFAHLRRKEGRRARLHLVDAAVVEGASAGGERNDVVAAARGREVVDLVRKALEDLDPAYRDVLYLHLFEGLAPAEVAQQLGLGRVVVRVRLFRGLRRLRSKLPDALALLLLAVLSRPGRAQVPLWLSGTAVAGLAASIAFAVDFGGDSATSGTAEIARVEMVATEPRGVDATAAVEVDGFDGASRQGWPQPALSVLVRDEHGRPLPSVGLELAPSSGSDAKLATRRAHTDERGVVEFAAVPDGDFVLRSDRGPQQAVALRSAPQHVELEVRGGSTLHGRVVDERGDAVPFATIWMATSADDTLSGTDVAIADRDGAFALDGVKAGALIAARAEGRARIAAQPLDPSLPCELVLAAVGGSIEGVVVSADGEPVADALVVVGAGREGANARVADDVDLTLPPPVVVRTDARGAFVASGLERGPVPIVVRKSGFAPHCTSLRVEPLEVV